MPPTRLYNTQRRRSSTANGLTHVKAGSYGIRSPSPPSINISGKPLQFAPNVTPGTYLSPPSPSPDSDENSPASSVPQLFPPALLLEDEAPRPRRRQPPGKRLSQGYVPRPPNAFMLFRAEFVKQKHVPGSIETSHGSLSKIIGNCWRALPLDEKAIWEKAAKEAKILHSQKYPNYKFRPVHNKHKKRCELKKARTSDDEERRCEEVAQLLLEGKKGDELARAVRELDMRTQVVYQDRRPSMRDPYYTHPYLNLPRRSSSVPPPNAIALQPAPFLTLSRPRTPSGPVASIARSNRNDDSVNMSMDNISAGMYLHGRRASTAQPRLMDVDGDAVLGLPWPSHPSDYSYRETYLRYQEMVQHQPEFLQSYDWQQAQQDSSSPAFHEWMGQAQYDREPSPVPDVDASLFEKSFLERSFSTTTTNPGNNFNLASLYTTLPPDARLPTDLESASSSQSYQQFPTPPWGYPQNQSLPSSQYSGSPALSATDSMVEQSWSNPTPPDADPAIEVHAPQPHPGWGLGLDLSQQQQQQQLLQQQVDYPSPLDINVAYDIPPHEYAFPPKTESAPTSPLLHYRPAQQMYDPSGCGYEQQQIVAPEFGYHDMIQEHVY
ncbi:hypothetical protein NEOLEDRAFT_1134471 [Neolentinus lepideus HHB14362 ss-1]|uniref:HMG box domain-containing protein n=1 Tax=Neolentinus lepideus HHB14362 ss-1 TaxID=1314782 RepID=A0A165S8N4_9AGAM|nr:hypothetical protein NEOLEDRAFT_1134471 [Neolentinus lepideus HHB14362 ss-1]